MHTKSLFRRSQASIVENANSIGLKSGEYGGRNKTSSSIGNESAFDSKMIKLYIGIWKFLIIMVRPNTKKQY